MIVLTGAKSSIFLGDKEEWGSLRRFGRDNTTGLEVFFDEGFTSIFFCGVQWVDFGDLGNKSVLEVNSVVKWAMRGELLIGFL